MNNLMNKVAIKFMTMLIEKSKPILDANVLLSAEEGIKVYENNNQAICGFLLKEHERVKKDLLKDKEIADIYKDALQEYQKITALLFHIKKDD